MRLCCCCCFGAHTQTHLCTSKYQQTHAHKHKLKTAMTVVLVAFKRLVEGSKKNTLAPLVCQTGARADRHKGGRAGGPPGSLTLYSKVDLDTDLFYWHSSPSPSLSFTLVFPISLSLSFLTPLSPFSLGPLSPSALLSLSLPFLLPSLRSCGLARG